MQTDNGRTTSLWMASADTPAPPRLAEDARCDVCIVGAGIAGLTTAYLLAREGKKVIVLDDGPLAGGESARTSAHLAFYIDDGLSEIEKLHGFDGLKLAVESHLAAVDRIEAIARDEAIGCNIARVNAYLFVAPDGDGHDYLEKEIDAAHRAGLQDAHWVDRAPMTGVETGRCLCFPRHAQFHPLHYLRGVAQAILRNGGKIHTQTHAANVTGGQPAQINTSQGRTITADAVVVATNTPVNDLVAIHTKQAAYRTYIVGLKVPKGAITRALYWDTLEAYHYVRVADLDDAHELLIVGGEDHKTGHAYDVARRYHDLEQWARAHFPEAQERAFHWSGQVMEPVDNLAFIGRNPLDADNVFIATGDSGMGLTHGTIAGMLLSDLIAGRSNPWEKLYDPSRITLKLQSAAQFAKENIDVAAQYATLLTPGEVKEASEIARDSGAILRRGAGKVAVYRDRDGQLHERSAICPHLGCVLAWNPTEKSWDCPCHGSRFNTAGEVVNGPANTNLTASTAPAA